MRPLAEVKLDLQKGHRTLEPRWVFDWRCCWRNSLWSEHSLFQRGHWNEETYPLEVALIMESPITVSAITSIMAVFFHMLICGGKRIELLITHLACDFGRPMIECVHMLIGRFLVPKFFWASFAADLRLPMANVCYMLVRCVCRAEQLRTCIALISWSPVICVVHVLFARGTSPKNLTACFASWPVTIFILMPRSFDFKPEGSCAGLARIHREKRQRIWQLLNGYSGRLWKVQKWRVFQRWVFQGMAVLDIPKSASCRINIPQVRQASCEDALSHAAAATSSYAVCLLLGGLLPWFRRVVLIWIGRLSKIGLFYSTSNMYFLSPLLSIWPSLFN